MKRQKTREKEDEPLSLDTALRTLLNKIIHGTITK